MPSGPTCRSARKVVTAVRDAEDWRGAYFGDTWGYVEYSLGQGYDADGYLKVRQWRCTYLLRGFEVLGLHKYVLVSCRSPLRSDGTPVRGGWLVSFQLHGR